MKKISATFLVICINLMLSAYSATVVYNPNSHIYHSPDCTYAKRCKCCIKISKKQAIKYGGRPCKVCGGTTSKK